MTDEHLRIIRSRLGWILFWQVCWIFSDWIFGFFGLGLVGAAAVVAEML